MTAIDLRKSASCGVVSGRRAIGSDASRGRPVLVGLGDSVTAGVGDSAADLGWSAHVADLIGARLVNLGRNGARAADVLIQQLPIALQHAPDIAVIFAGGNDVLRGDFDSDVVAESLTRVVLAMLAGGAQVVLVMPPPIGAELPGPRALRRVLGRRMQTVRERVEEISEHLRQQCAAGQLMVVDAGQVRVSGGRAVFHIDRIHPSPVGHRLLARLVAAQLAANGWPTVGTVSAVPPPPRLVAKVGWLVVKGVPWLARRSSDLLPELIRVVIAEERSRRRNCRRPSD